MPIPSFAAASRSASSSCCFGHQHHAYERLVWADGGAKTAGVFGETKWLRAFCCPTTLQYDAPGKGVHLFDFLSPTAIEFSSFAAVRDDDARLSPFEQVRTRTIDLAAEPTKEEAASATDPGEAQGPGHEGPFRFSTWPLIELAVGDDDVEDRDG